MIADLKPYEEYKDSGLPWLGEIPSHWKTKRAKSVLFAIDERSKTGREELLTVSSALGVIPRRGAAVTMFKAKTYKGYKLCWPDDLAINSLWAWGGGLGVSRHHGIISTAYGVYRIRHMAEFHPSYLHALVRSRPFNWELVMRSKGIWKSRLQLTDDSFLNAPIPILPHEEQELIVQFLRWVNLRFDKMIRAKRRVISLLEEQRKVVIQSAITETIGDDCPTVPIRAMLRPIKRLGYPNKMILSLFRDYGVIPKESRENKNVDVRDLSLCQLVEPGDVVMNKMKAWQGSIAVSELEGIASPDYMVLKFQMEPVVGKFFHYVLRSPNMIAEYRRNAYGVRPGQWRLMYQEFSQLRLPLPAEELQQAVVDRITKQTTALDNAIASEQKQVKLLREYRTRLISDVVTGKLDVRDVARSLPESVGSESIDMSADSDFGSLPDEETELAEEAV